MPNVSFTAPTDYAAQLADIQRKQKLADMLMQQGITPIEQYSAGGMAGKTSWTQLLAKALQMGMAGYKEGSLKKQQADIGKQYQQDLADTLSEAMKAQSGVSATPDTQPTTFTGGVAGPEGTPMPQQSPMLDELGQSMPAIPGQPAVAKDPVRAAMLLMKHPATQAIGQSELMKVMSEMRRQELLKNMGIGVPAAAPQGQAGATQQSPGISQRPSGMMVDPMAAQLTLADDPMLQQLGKMQESRAAKMSEPVNVRQGGAVYVPGQSQPAFVNPRLPEGMIAQYGGASQNPSAAVIPGFGQAATDISSIPKPGAPPVQVPMSGGQTAQLGQPEWLRLQQSGQMPQRYQQNNGIAPTVTVGDIMGIKDPAERAAIMQKLQQQLQGSQAPQAGGLGVPGLTQSQESQIVQKGAASASVEAGKESMASMYRTYEKLQDVPQQLQNIEQAKALVPQAAGFMGPGGESLLGAAKFLNNRIGTSINTEGVKNSEELRTRIFMNVMDNLKKMDAQPSQLQQQIMQQALGSLGTDPSALPRMLDAYGQALATKVQLHNSRVANAKQAGVVFAGGDPIINMSAPAQTGQIPQSAQPVQPMQPQMQAPRMVFNPATGKIERR